MTEPIRLEFVYAADDYARGSLFIARRNWAVRFIYALFAAGIWAIYGLIYLLSTESFRSFLFNNLIVVVLATGFLMVLGLLNGRKGSNAALRRRFQMQIDSTPAMQEPKYVSVDGVGISSTLAIGSGDVSWSDVIEVVETRDDYFFFTARNFAQFIPKHAFADEGEQSRLRTILRERFGNNAKLLQ